MSDYSDNSDTELAIHGDRSEKKSKHVSASLSAPSLSKQQTQDLDMVSQANFQKHQDRLEKVEAQMLSMAGMLGQIEKGMALLTRKRSRSESVSRSETSSTCSDSDDDVISRPKKKTKADKSKSSVTDKDKLDEVILHEDGELDSDIEKICSDKTKSIANVSGKKTVTEIEQEVEQDEEIGEKVSDSLAGIVNKRFENSLSEKTLKTRQNRNKRPENCVILTPGVNKRVWKKATYKKQKEDLKLVDIQRSINKAAMAVIAITNDMMTEQETGKGIMNDEDKLRAGLDAIALLGHASKDISFRRRFYLRSCTGSLYDFWDDTEIAPITEKLFGNDIAASNEKAKKIERMNGNDKKRYRRRRRGHGHGYQAGFLRRKNQNYNREQRNSSQSHNKKGQKHWKKSYQD